jgi:phosphomannomutase
MTDLPLRASADGWRGLIGTTFTPDAAARLAACAVETVPAGQVLVTHDGRHGGHLAALRVAAAAGAAGAERVRLVPHLPTPTATAAVRQGRADLAILVTASHNPASWNGVKIKIPPGCPLPGPLEREIDGRYRDDTRLFGPGEVERCDGSRLMAEHFAEVLAKAGTTPATRVRVVVDGLSGIAGGPMARLCAALNWEVHELGCVPDPDFAGLVPDPTLPRSRRRAAERVRVTGADLGVILDGDGDRLSLLDHRGRDILPHEVFGLLLEHRHRRGREARGIAVTTATGSVARQVAGWLGAPVTEVAVGFKHLTPLLLSGRVDAAAGGVGDLTFAEYGVDRDPFAAVVLLADLLERTGCRLADLVDDLRARAGARDWFESRVPGRRDPGSLHAAGHRALLGAGLAGSVRSVTDLDGVKFWLDDAQWLLLRASSTEGGVRVYGELNTGRNLAGRLIDIITTCLNHQGAQS